MLFEKFVTEASSAWDSYLQGLSTAQANGTLVLTSGHRHILYPNILLITDCAGFYVAEVVGATREYKGLKLKRRKDKSIYRYLNQFEDILS